MITPFGPPGDELDRLNSALDAQVTGKLTPETRTASDTEMFAATAHSIALQSETQGETPSTDTLDAIWRNVMHAHAIPEQPAPAAALPGATPDNNRNHVVRGPEPPTVASWISLAAVAALLIGIVGVAWGLREGGGGDEPQFRPAATALDETPVAENASEWLTWVTPEECTAEPMTTEEYAEIMREEPDISDRSYDVVGPADPETAEAVANAARAHEACTEYGTIEQTRSLQTEGYIFFRSATIDRTLTTDELFWMRIEHAQQISEGYPQVPPSTDVEVTDEIPPFLEQARTYPHRSSYGTYLGMYDPANVMMLDDGRATIPITFYFWETSSPPTIGADTAGALITGMYIFEMADEQWKVDEWLEFCAGECAPLWADYRGTPTAQLPFPISEPDPGATPIATPKD